MDLTFNQIHQNTASLILNLEKEKK